MGTGALFQHYRQLGHEADHSSPSSVEVNNDTALTPLSHAFSWCHDQLIKHRDNFTFYLYFYMT
jgi:hypothetical protein